MELYILDNNDLSTLSILECSDYEINLDNQFTDKSTFRVNKAPGQIKDNFLVVNGLYQQFLFIIDEVEATDKEEKFVNLVCSDISNIFNRKIIEQDTNLMTTRSIEYFLAHMMDVNFVNSDDSVLNKSYINITYTEHTQAKVQTNAENGIYNFHTFMENCREYQNVYVDFSIENKHLNIEIKYKNDTPVTIDTTIPEITHYNKVYEQDITAKVTVYVRETNEILNWYLKTDRTVTTNKNDPNRAAGAIEVISVDTLDVAEQEALNVFKGNTYKHLVEFSMSKNSKLVDTTTLYIGRAIIIKTPDGIYESIISGISLDDDNFVNFKSGNIRITFIDKLKQEQENYGNKLDVTGGTIKGNLTTNGNQTTTGNQITTGNTTIGKTDGSTSFQIHGGSSSNIYWKEYDYGDKFRIIPEFGGTDDSNKLRIQGAVGGQGTDPALYDLMTISGKSGNTDIRGTYSTATTTATHINGAKGIGVVLNNTAGAGYNMLARQKSTNGVFNLGVWNDNYNLFYISDSVVSAGTNTYNHRVKLLDENGNSSFPCNVSIGNSVKIPKKGDAGAGLTNSDGVSIIRDHNNKNVTVDATGDTLFLGYQDTKAINILNGKDTISTDGTFTFPKGIGINFGSGTMKGNSQYGDLHINNTGGYTYLMVNGTNILSVRSNGLYGKNGYPYYCGKDLYNNSSGTNGNITLSETAANFTFIDVFFIDSHSRVQCARSYSPNGRQILLYSNSPFAKAKTCMADVAARKFNGTAFNLADDEYGTWNSWNNTWNRNNNIKILEVVGWRTT